MLGTIHKYLDTAGSKPFEYSIFCSDVTGVEEDQPDKFDVDNKT